MHFCVIFATILYFDTSISKFVEHLHPANAENAPTRPEGVAPAWGQLGTPRWSLPASGFTSSSLLFRQGAAVFQLHGCTLQLKNAFNSKNLYNTQYVQKKHSHDRKVLLIPRTEAQGLRVMSAGSAAPPRASQQHQARVPRAEPQRRAEDGGEEPPATLPG